MSGRASSTTWRASHRPLKVRDQHLDRTAGHRDADLGDGAGEDRRPAVRLVVPVDGGHTHGVPEAHPGHGEGDPPRLIGVRRPARQARL